MTYVVGSAEIEVVPSTKGFHEKLGALLGDLKADVKLEPDVAGLRAKLSEVGDLKIGVDLDMGDSALRIDALTRPRTLVVVPEVLPTAGLGLGGAPAAGLGGLPAAGGGLAALGPAGMVAGIVAGVAALAALFGPIVAVTAGLTGIIAPALGALAVFGLLEQRAISTDKALSGALKPALDGLSKAFDQLVKQNSGALLAPLIAGIQLLSSLLPLATPLIQAVSAALVQLIQPIQQAVKDGTFAKWVAQIVPLIGPAFRDGGRILADLGKGIGSIIEAFTKNGQGQKLLDGLAGMMDGFAKIGSNKDFKQFVKYSIDNIPLLVRTTDDLAKAVIILAQGFTVIGVPLLHVVDGLASFITVAGASIKALSGTKDSMAGAKGASDDFNTSLGGLGHTAGNWLVDADKGLINGVKTWGRTVGQWLVDTDSSIVNGFKGWTHSVGNGLVDIDKRIIDGVRGFGRTIGNWLVDADTALINGVKGWGRDIGNGLVGADRWLIGAGEAIVHGLAAGIQRAWSGFLGWVHGLIMQIPAAIRQALGINSPSKVTDELGEFTGQGYQAGLVRSLNRAMDAAQAVLRARTNTFAATANVDISQKLNASVQGGSTWSNERIIELLERLLTKMPSAQDNAHAAQLLGRAGVRNA